MKLGFPPSPRDGKGAVAMTLKRKLGLTIFIRHLERSVAIQSNTSIPYLGAAAIRKANKKLLMKNFLVTPCWSPQGIYDTTIQ